MLNPRALAFFLDMYSSKWLWNLGYIIEIDKEKIIVLSITYKYALSDSHSLFYYPLQNHH